VTGSDSFRLGVNYWPARTAMYWWDDVRFPEVDRDMARIADLGLQEARIFLLWEAFQPRPDRVSDDALLRLETALRAAERHDVGLVLSLFCGHMSGVNWLPGWAVDQSAASTIRTVSGGQVVPGGAGDIYADPALLDAQLFLAQRLASTFAGHAGLAGWDLGNEFSNLRWPARPEEIARWSRPAPDARASVRQVAREAIGADRCDRRGLTPSTSCPRSGLPGAVAGPPDRHERGRARR